MNRLQHTVDFLGEFTTAGKFKQVTHRFELDSKQDYLYYVNKCRTSLLNYDGLLPDGLFDFLFGFFFGPKWCGANGRSHEDFCGCEKWVEWCINNPGVHPFESKDSFRDDISDFKNSIRVYGGDLPRIIEDFKVSIQNVSIEYDKKNLRKFDAYTYVPHFKTVIASIINDIDVSRFSKEHPSVKISTFREKNEMLKDVFIDTVCIENIDSYPPQTLSSAMKHYNGSGGFLSTLKKMCEGYFLLSVDTLWEERPIRWNLIGLENSPETESIPCDEMPINGFRYNIRIPHKV